MRVDRDTRMTLTPIRTTTCCKHRLFITNAAFPDPCLSSRQLDAAYLRIHLHRRTGLLVAACRILDPSNDPFCLGPSPLGDHSHSHHVLYNHVLLFLLPYDYSTIRLPNCFMMFQAVPQTFAHHQTPSPPMDSMLTMPETTLMTVGPNGGQKPRKMRASCDACSRAKVRQ